MTHLPAAMLTVVLLTVSAARAQPAVDYSGTWKMDPARSESAHNGEPFRPVTLVIAQTATELRIDSTRGADKETVVYPLGQAASVPSDTVHQPEAYWIGERLVTESQRPVNGQLVSVRQTRTLAAGGREMRVETTIIVQHGYTMAGAKNYSTVHDVFVRTEGK
jgi:hypothetical protein